MPSALLYLRGLLGAQSEFLGQETVKSKSCYIQVLEEVKIPERQMPKEIKIAQEVPSVMVDNSELQLAARRTREPPKNASQIYCDHPDCRNHIPYFKRRSEWSSLPLRSLKRESQNGYAYLELKTITRLYQSKASHPRLVLMQGEGPYEPFALRPCYMHARFGTGAPIKRHIHRDQGEQAAHLVLNSSKRQLLASSPLAFKPHVPQYRYSDQVEDIVDTEERTHEDEVEEQISYSGNSMASDSVTPALEGFPDVEKFDQLMKRIPEMLVQQYIKICPTCSPVLSEPPVPALEGLPNVIEFDKRMASYIKHLPDELRDKATISWSMAGKIGKALLGDTTKPVEFQDWSKKMFTLGRINGQLSVFREGKPIATEEKFFKILTTAHQKCEHGDQKKTSAEVNELYSWVPEELIR
ncbi:predicted protein [Histoplasma mississippiense (nom. inval.)]|uniref:predicted protein n=1 Tax=Ajellomyces capsulatus (strain NAm1 / WU24) TaxID=2059318 RepID=UPI000157BDF3|nr:predicted protein [Histoplasma mississippiense (nom. inval.)]EDN06073.1 predicted protein [Histoplasma mississippiense (nom. inval.)]